MGNLTCGFWWLWWVLGGSYFETWSIYVAVAAPEPAMWTRWTFSCPPASALQMQTTCTNSSCQCSDPYLTTKQGHPTMNKRQAIQSSPSGTELKTSVICSQSAVCGGGWGILKPDCSPVSAGEDRGPSKARWAPTPTNRPTEVTGPVPEATAAGALSSLFSGVHVPPPGPQGRPSA